MSFDSLDAFRAAIAPLSAEEADAARDRFARQRLDATLLDPMPDALRIKEFSDGPGYDGYLWDFLVDKHVVTEAEFWRRLGGVPDVYVMWDLHSVDRIRIPDYFRFPRGTVMRTDPAILRGGIKYLPEDFYVYDEAATWAGALTHEYVDDERFCLWSGPPPSRGRKAA